MNRQAIVKQKISAIYKRLEFSTQNRLNSLVNSTGKSQTIHQKSGQIYMKNVHKKMKQQKYVYKKELNFVGQQEKTEQNMKCQFSSIRLRKKKH